MTMLANTRLENATPESRSDAVIDAFPLTASPGAEKNAGRVLVDVKNLHICFPTRARDPDAASVVRGIDITVHAGECVALVGESGSGKSVTARSLLGLAGSGARIDASRFDIDGRDARTFTARHWREVRGGFAGLVMQDALVSLDPLRTIGAEIGEARALHHPRESRRARDAGVLALLRKVGMVEPERRVRQRAGALSGGLRQRALIAAAMAAQPALLIADEPTTALDVTVQAQVLDVLRQRLRAGVGLLLISHDLALVSGIADRVIVLHHGEVVDSGPTAKVLSASSHAYTRRLLAARPSLHSRGFALRSADIVAVPMPGSAAMTHAVVRQPLPPRQGDAPGTLPAASTTPILSVQGINKRYTLKGDWHASSGHFIALDDVSFSVNPGEVVGIVGESGSGKSTIAKIVLGLLSLDGGAVTFAGSSWNHAHALERERTARRSRLRYIPQDPLGSFDPRYTVRDLLREALHDIRHAQALTPDEVLARSVMLLEQVSLDAGVLSRYPITLSGGQRQRIAIARAVASEPDLIVCDEPVSALDVHVQAQVLDVLAKLQRRNHTAVLFISHDLDVIAHISDRVLVLHNGRVVEQGPTPTVYRAPTHPYTRTLLASAPTLPIFDAAATLANP
ncbi:ABC transporter ATP-binding protein [Robbsia andropogonis]|uniref:ABC transporter ATP-binding protein n=1 Tax=Robbsia andropogonis TaxID=28092 RepID=UPI002A6A6ED6|nr:ABC transporter ATP-binding protein [Robbsia andropogonis]